ncbi:MAG: hypothetical protein KGM47_13400 [Acidobacteriota bacterium]|nr:hypothetical protein [Acidobacteriota bacterium]
MRGSSARLKLAVHFGQAVDARLCEWFRVLGLRGAISSNSQQILHAARRSFRQNMNPEPTPDLSMSLCVDSNASGSPPSPQPYFRGLSHLVYAGLDSKCSMLLDLRRRRGIGRFSLGKVAGAEVVRQFTLSQYVERQVALYRTLDA